LAKRHPSRQRYRILELQRWRDKRGLKFHLHPQFAPFDPSLADKIICAMTQAGVDPEKFIAAAFKGIFEDQRNLADDADLALTLADAGYEPHWLERGKSAEAAERYAANVAQGLTEGIFGSPSYLLDGEVFWGQDRLDLLDDALTSGRESFSADA
jgi:2-hydroxychromene-2-carboxylate isomerase